MSEVADDFVANVGSLVGLGFTGGPFSKRRKQLSAGSAAAGWVCGLEHAREGRVDGAWRHSAIAAPVMAGSRYRGRPVYFGDVIVSEHSSAASLDDLGGLDLAVNETGSLSGCQMLIDACGSLGRFATTVDSGSHVESIRMVREGAADVACIDSTLLDMARARAILDLSGVRVLLSLGPYPAPPIVASEQIAGEVRRRLEALHTSEEGRRLLSAWGVERFVAVADDDYRGLAARVGGSAPERHTQR